MVPGTYTVLLSKRVVYDTILPCVYPVKRRKGQQVNTNCILDLFIIIL